MSLDYSDSSSQWALLPVSSDGVERLPIVLHRSQRSAASRSWGSRFTTLLRRCWGFVLLEGFGGLGAACAVGLVGSQVELQVARYSATPVEHIESAIGFWPFEPKIRHALLEWPWRNPVEVGMGLKMIMEYQRNDPRSGDARVARGMFEQEARRMMLSMKRKEPELQRIAPSGHSLMVNP